VNQDLTVEPTLHDAADLAGILVAEYRYSALFRDDAFAHEMFHQIALRVLKSSGRHYGFALRRDGKLLGVVTRSIGHHRMFGCVVADLFIALMPQEPSAIVWAESVLNQMDWQLSHITVGRISGYHQTLLPCLSALGVGIDAVGLVASTQSALDCLNRHYDVPGNFRHLGLSHSVMKVTDLDCVLELRARCFRLAPEYCWFGANSGHLLVQRQRLTADLEQAHAWWVIRDGPRIVGSFGSSVTPHNPMWGPVGGLELIFDSEYQAKGMSKIAYAMTLTQLLKQRCNVFKGITAQSPVMHLGKIMGRRLFDIHLRSAPDFEASHFRDYLPDLFLGE
jgi:hypothetical protein